MNSEQLAAKVKARNRVNALALEMAPKLLEALKPFVGEKVVKTTGGWMQKFEKVLPKLPSDTATHSYYTAGHGYSIRVCFRANEMANNHSCMYAENNVYLADLTNGVIQKLYELPKPEYFRTDYTAEEIRKLEQDIREAQSKLSTFQSRLSAFME